MSMPMPPQLEAARSQLSKMLEQVEKRPVDLEKAPWPEIEKSVIKLLGGPFNPNRQDHQLVALGLAAAFGLRMKDDKAFWFPNREAPEGAQLGFPDALITLAPFGAVMDSLVHAKLERLDEVVKEIRGALAKVKFGGGAPQQLQPEDYMRLFDPGFVQVVAMEAGKTKEAWNKAPDRLALDLRDAIGRAAKLPAEVKQQLEQQLVGALQRLEAGKPLLGQVARAPRVAEMMGLIFGGGAATGSAPEEFWAEVVLPLMFVGAPEKFPDLDEEELDAAKKGIHPLFLFLDVVPFSFKSPEEEGLLGAFPGDELTLPDAAFNVGGPARLIGVGLSAVKPAIEAFNAAKTKDALKRFGAHLEARTGKVNIVNGAEADQMFDAALILLEDLQKVVKSGQQVFVRRLTEAEAASEPALGLVRQSAQGPRIILTA